MSEPGAVKDVVREKYGQAALRVKAGQGGCCGSAPGAMDCCAPITSNLYDSAQTGEVPDAALKASLGCGNPTALAELKPGETVLDLGSGGGIDVLLSARRVGPAGKAYGLDMTDEMLALAEADYTNKLAAAGFGKIELEVTRVFGSDDARTFLAVEGFDADAFANEVDAKFVSAFIRAVKPESCCAPGCSSR